MIFLPQLQKSQKSQKSSFPDDERVLQRQFSCVTADIVPGNEICFLAVNLILFPPFPVCGNDETIISKKKKFGD